MAKNDSNSNQGSNNGNQSGNDTGQIRQIPDVPQQDRTIIEKGGSPENLEKK